MLNLKENLEKLRGWIDGSESDISDGVVKAHEGKSASEKLLQKLLSAIEELLKDEIIRIPNTNKAYVPEKFLLFISEETSKTLRDDKRKFFEQSLSALILERAKEMAGKLDLTSKTIAIEILINGILDKDEIEVKISSDNELTKSQTIEFVQSQERIKNSDTIDESGTVDDFDTFIGILYRAEIWQMGKKINEIPIVQRQITIGRDDADKVANLRLPSENRKMSRKHAEINLEENGELWITALHKNPVVVGDKAIRSGEKAKIEMSGEIQVYDFIIKIKTK